VYARRRLRVADAQRVAFAAMNDEHAESSGAQVVRMVADGKPGACRRASIESEGGREARRRRQERYAFAIKAQYAEMRRHRPGDAYAIIRRGSEWIIAWAQPLESHDRQPPVRCVEAPGVVGTPRQQIPRPRRIAWPACIGSSVQAGGAEQQCGHPCFAHSSPHLRTRISR
jgi:hypothetical protein